MRRGYAIQPMDPPAVTVVVPTAGRAAYLEVTLDSLRRQRTGTAREILVIDDGATDATPEVAERFGARLIRHGERRNLNVARNTGVREARADLSRSWTTTCSCRRAGSTRSWRALPATRTPRPSGGRSGRASRATRRAAAAARSRRSRRWTSGTRIVEAEMVWGANFAVRRSAFERIGHSTRRATACTATRRTGCCACARPAAGSCTSPAPALTTGATRTTRRWALSRVAFERGRAARETDLRRGTAPGLARELRVLVGCGWHTLRRACPQGVVMGANSAGRVVETLRPR